MNDCLLHLAGHALHACSSGALWWPAQRVLAVSDLHLGKSERIARHGGAFLPPYETQDTIARLAEEVDRHNPAIMLCLGDSFDDLRAADMLLPGQRDELLALQAGRLWIWITGNHDPAPVQLGGSHLGSWAHKGLVFRHIAEPGAAGEISGHYHPKATLSVRGRRIRRACFLADNRRVIMPAFGTYTGGLRWTDPALQSLMDPGALAVLTGQTCCALPMPRLAETARR